MKIKLKKMNAVEFDRFLAYLIPNYANDLSTNFIIPLKKAAAESEKLTKELFPNKQGSDGQFVYHIYSIEEAKNVGVIWYNIQSDSNKAYIYHILIEEEFRNQGFGTEVLQEFEETMKKSGITSLGLNVFGTNPKAQKLYEKLGYETQSTAMGKRI